MRFTRRVEQNNRKSSNEKQIVDFGRNEINFEFLVCMVIWYKL